MTVDLLGYAFNLAGGAVEDATAQVLTKNTTTQIATVDTDSNGKFEFSGIAEGLYDIKVTSGSSVRWRKYDDEIQTAVMEAGSLRLRGTNGSYAHVFQGTPSATRTITFPDEDGTVVLTSTATDITLDDDVDISWGTGADALMRWSDGDGDNHALALGLGDTSQQFHITDKAAIGTDWARSAGTHPEVAIHSNTTPASDYLAIGNHDGTTASIDVVGGTTLDLRIAGTDELQITAAGIDTNGGTVTGTTITGATALVGGTIAGTSGTFSGIVDITLVTDATDATGDTGALRTEGGASIAKKLYVGGDLNVTGNATITGTTTLNGALVLGDAAGDTLSITASATVSTDFKFADDVDIALGTNADILMRNRSTSAAANLEITDIIIGTSVHPGVAANSLLVSNITASGDMMFLTNRGGNSEAHMLFDASAGDTYLYARGVQAMKITGGGAIVVTPSITANGGVVGNLTGNVTGNADTVTTNANLTGDVTSSGNATTIAAGAVDTAHIGDNQVTLAKMAGIARGKIIYGDASGNPAVLASGTASQVLTMTDGDDFDWADANTGDITGVTAGAGLSGGGSSGGVTLALDLSSSLSDVTPANGDKLATLDSDGSTEQLTTVASLATLFAGAGMTATSSVVNVIGGDGITANANDVAITPANTNITSIYNAALAVGYGASHANINFATDNQIIFDIDGTPQIELLDGILQPVTDADINLGATAKRFQTVYGQQYHMDASVDGIAEHSYAGMSATIRVGDGADIGAFDLVCISDVTNEVQKANASAIATAKVIGINPSNSAISDNSEGTILLHGFVRDDSWSWTTGQTLYLSGGTAGDITATAPSTTNHCVVPIGVALEPDMIYFNPTQTIIEHA